MLNTGCCVKAGSRLSSMAAANRSVNRIRSSNSRIGNSPASLVSGAGETSTWMGRVGKKLSDSGGTDCRLMEDLRVDVQGRLLKYLIRQPRSLLLAHRA